MNINKNKQQDDSHGAETKLVSNCQQCNAVFRPEQVSVVGDEGHAQLLHVQCYQCATAMVLLLLVSEHGMGSVGLITDLNGAEVAQFSSLRGSVTANDVLQVHSLLKFDFIATI